MSKPNSRQFKYKSEVLVLIILITAVGITGCPERSVPGSTFRVAKVDTEYVHEANVAEFVVDYRESRRTQISNFVGFEPNEILAAREYAIDNEVRREVKRLPGVNLDSRELRALADEQMEELAWELYDDLTENGARFADLAREFSSGSSAQLGGQLAPFGEFDDPEECLRNMITRMLHFFKESEAKKEVAIFIEQVTYLSGEYKEKCNQQHREIFEIFQSKIRELNEKKRANPISDTVAAFGILGAMNWVYLWFKDDGTMAIEDVAQDLTTLLLSGLIPKPAE